MRSSVDFLASPGESSRTVSKIECDRQHESMVNALWESMDRISREGLKLSLRYSMSEMIHTGKVFFITRNPISVKQIELIFKYIFA